MLKVINSSAHPKKARRPHAHRVIAENLREQILKGELAAGTELASTQDLADLWKTSKSTAHTALNQLVKEGLLERKHGSCTFVRERRLALTHMGIYYDSPKVWSDEEMAFYRSLQALLEEKLAKLGMQVTVFVDRRPQRKQRTVLPELARAVELRKIQGLIIPTGNDFAVPALLRLPVATSILTNDIEFSNRVNLSAENVFRNLLSRLAAKGCRSVGLISSVDDESQASNLPEAMDFSDLFLREAESFGMQTRREWLRLPKKYVYEKVLFGYNQFHELWAEPGHPDAVIVYPDVVARGVLTAALELGVHCAGDVTFCFHKNAHVDILCPFPVLWAISDEAKIAGALIDQVRRQYAGKSVSPVLFEHEIQETPGVGKSSKSQLRSGSTTTNSRG